MKKRNVYSAITYIINVQKEICLNLVFPSPVYFYTIQTYTEINFPIKFVQPRMQRTVTLFHEVQIHLIELRHEFSVTECSRKNITN